MSRSDEHRIADILSAADELSAIVNRGAIAYDNDPILRRAAERLLEIIGEAANQLQQETTDRHSEVPWRDIARLRIVLAHHYHRVDPGQVWVIATTHIPELVAALRKRED
jgi:uncharacterized protein with HEPN domain